jgi:hypothetical protein
VTAVVQVESASRWDALALARRLGGYRWYLVEPDDRHWEVRVAVEEPRRGLPDELRARIASWVEERHLPPVTVEAGGVAYTIAAGDGLQ